jgi:acyl carrier protein
MTDRQSMRDVALRALGEIAPEAQLTTLPGNQLLQEILDLDSFDFLTFVQALHDATGIDIPEVDYPQVATLDGVVAYLESKGATDVQRPVA